MKTRFFAVCDRCTRPPFLYLGVAVLYAGEFFGIWGKEVSAPIMAALYAVLSARGH